MNEKIHWLQRKTTIKKLWIILYCLLAISVLVELFVDVKAYFGLDGSFGFSAWFGFGACVLMVLFAKLLGWLIKRDEQYYND